MLHTIFAQVRNIFDFSAENPEIADWLADEAVLCERLSTNLVNRLTPIRRLTERWLTPGAAVDEAAVDNVPDRIQTLSNNVLETAFESYTLLMRTMCDSGIELLAFLYEQMREGGRLDSY